MLHASKPGRRPEDARKFTDLPEGVDDRSKAVCGNPDLERAATRLVPPRNVRRAHWRFHI
jgi:hypothetical protein